MPTSHDEPAEVTHAEGEVLIDGPDCVTSSMTPEAALETARRLSDVATNAIIDRAQHTTLVRPEPTLATIEITRIEDDEKRLHANAVKHSA